MALNLLAAAPTPQVTVDSYNTVRLQTFAVVYVKSSTPITVQAARLVNSTGGAVDMKACLPASQADQLFTSNTAANSCRDVTYFAVRFDGNFQPGRYVIAITTPKGSTTVSFYLS